MAKKQVAKKSKAKKKSGSNHVVQARLLKLFQIIAALKSAHLSVGELARRFDTSERTIYRYLGLLEEASFAVDQDFKNKYFIATSEDDPSQAQFTLEETRLIRELIQSGATSGPLKNSLLRKLALNSEMDSMPRLFLRARLGKFVEQLAGALQNKKQVIFKNYHSANSSVIRDRLVEPVHFGDNYETIVALDCQDKKCKQFKLDRIAEIIELDKSFQFEQYHQKTTTDIFNLTGDNHEMITLKLSLRAFLLIREEYPLSIPHIEQKEDHYLFYGPVSNFEGVGRFVLGLPGEVEVKGPKSFQEFLEEKRRKVKLSRP